MLEGAGENPHELLAEFGLSPSYFEDPENIIPFTTMGRILTRCVERTQCDHFGLLAGQRSGLSVMGTVGYVARSAPDVGTALGEMAAYLHIHDGGAVLNLSVDRSVAALSYAILVDGVESSEQILDGAMAIAFNIMRELCGPEWKLSGLRLAHSKQGRLEPFKKFFGVTPYFDADQSELIFAAKWLGCPLPSADPTLHKLMIERASELQILTRDDVVGQLRRILKPLVSSSNCTLELAAKRLGVSGRTLDRRLALLGTSFRDIREDVRLQAACQLLRNTGKPSYEIAEILGYSDATAFTRAFRRWAKTAPGQWRTSHRQTGAKTSRRNKST